jgi:hypothetical protein
MRQRSEPPLLTLTPGPWALGSATDLQYDVRDLIAEIEEAHTSWPLVS